MTAGRRPRAAGLPPSPVAGTAAFSKFMDVLQRIADAAEPPTVAALVRASGYPRPTVHRIVAALAAEGLVQDAAQGGAAGASAGGAFVPGPRLLRLASRAWGRSDLRLAAVDALKALRDRTGETVHLAVPSGRAMVYIEKLESPSAVRMASRIGASVALHATAVGKAWMAGLDDAALEAVLDGLPLPSFTPGTLCDGEALRAALRTVRAQGWAVDDEEHEPGIHCFGAAIRGARGEPVAAVSVSTLRFLQKDDPRQAYVEPLLDACRTISERLAQAPPRGEVL